MLKAITNSLFIFLLSFSLHAFCQTEAQALEIHSSCLNQSLTQFSIDIDKIYAVHATRSLPESDYLRAGFNLDHCSSLEKAMMPKVRQTLHFALGELVRPLEGFMSWEDCPYAIVTSLRTLLPQLLNINCYDTFILGDLKLTAETYLLVPHDVAGRIESHATVITYDPNMQTLRETVDMLIMQKEGWHIEMNSEDIEDELHEAFLNGYNINVAEFFAPLKDQSPCLAVGLRFDDLDGEHYRLSQIEMSLSCIAMEILSNTYRETRDYNCLATSLLEDFPNTVNEHFAIWSSTLTHFNWCNESLEAYHNLASEITKWEHLIKAELLLRKLYQKTLMSAPSDFLLQSSTLLKQPDEFQDFVIQNRDLLLDYPPEPIDADFLNTTANLTSFPI